MKAEINEYIERAIAISQASDVSHMALEFWIQGLGTSEDEETIAELVKEEMRAWASDALGEAGTAYQEGAIDRICFLKGVPSAPKSCSLFLCFPLLAEEDGDQIVQKAKALAEAIGATYLGAHYSYWPDIAADVNRFASDYETKLQHPIWF